MTLPQFSQQGFVLHPETQLVILHLQLIVLLEAAMEGQELPTLTKQVPLCSRLLWVVGGGLKPFSPRPRGSLKADYRSKWWLLILEGL